MDVDRRIDRNRNRSPRAVRRSLRAHAHCAHVNGRPIPRLKTPSRRRRSFVSRGQYCCDSHACLSSGKRLSADWVASLAFAQILKKIGARHSWHRPAAPADHHTADGRRRVRRRTAALKTWVVYHHHALPWATPPLIRGAWATFGEPTKPFQHVVAAHSLPDCGQPTAVSLNQSGRFVFVRPQ